MSQLRPYSQASSNRSSSKPGFQTKLKPRIAGLGNYQQKMNKSTDINRDQNISQIYSPRKNQIKQNDQINKYQDNQFYKTASKLSSVNFQNHHDIQHCVCSQCSCGRHLCKLNNIKPDLTKNSIYKQDFNKKSVNSPQIIKAAQYGKLNGPHLDMNSTHRDSFKGKQTDKIQRPKPQDLLKSQGPSLGLTSYRSGFPGFRGQNQYIKPTDNHFRDHIPFRSKSTYNHTFVNKDPKKDDYKYMNDMLKTGGNFYGKSTYGNFFQNPNPQYHAKKVKLIEKHNQNPNFTRQYQTVYKNDFIPKQTAICAAKIHLQTIGRGKFTGTKNVFSQNSDFKAMSPEYQAFSTSGFSFA